MIRLEDGMLIGLLKRTLFAQKNNSFSSSADKIIVNKSRGDPLSSNRFHQIETMSFRLVLGLSAILLKSILLLKVVFITVWAKKKYKITVSVLTDCSV